MSAGEPGEPRSLRVAVLGAGGLGSVVAAFCARAGADVTMIGRAQHVDAVRAHGLRVTGREEFIVEHGLHGVSSPADIDGHFDYTFVCVKNSSLQHALSEYAELLESSGSVVSLLNGVRADELLAELVGTRALGAAVAEGGTLVGPGHVHRAMAPPRMLLVGEFGQPPSARVASLVALLERAGLGAAAVHDVTEAKWEKLAQLCIAASWAGSTLGRTDVGLAAGLQIDEGARHYLAIATEVLAVFGGLGFTPRNYFAPGTHLCELAALGPAEALAFVINFARQLDERSRGAARLTIQRDLISGRRTEAAQIIVPFLSAADRLGLPTPTLTAAYRVIATLESLASPAVAMPVG
jgi:2-dehydropantoate 2-reductase